MLPNSKSIDFTNPYIALSPILAIQLSNTPIGIVTMGKYFSAS